MTSPQNFKKPIALFMTASFLHTSIYHSEANAINLAPATGRKPSANAPAASDANSKMKFKDASIEDITNENFPDLIESFDYPNAEITEVIRAISKLTGKNFIVDPGVRGKITVIAPSQITVAEAWKAFLSALAINGFTVVPSGQFLKIKPAREANRDSIETYSGNYFPNSDQLITRIVKLKYISADEANKNLRSLTTKFGEMNPYQQTNSLIISDFGSNIERIMSIINELDQPGFEERLEVIPILHAKSKTISDLVQQIINKGEGGSAPGGFSPANRFRSSLQGSSSGGKGNVNESLSMVAPDERTNAIIVVGNDAGIQKIKGLIKRLDYPIDPSESGGVYVYYVKHGEAKSISQTLSGIAQEAEKSRDSDPAGGGGLGGANRFVPPTAKTQAIFGGDVKIAADENTNSLVITASKQDYGVVLSLLERLDITKDQVYVEAYIVEMTNQDNSVYDMTYYQFLNTKPGETSTGAAKAGFSSSGNLASILNPTAATPGAIMSFGGGSKFKLALPGGAGEVTIPSLLGFLNFLKTYVDINILSTPQIIAIDNEDAEIEVGEEVPIQTSTASVGVQAASIQYKNATIKLKIKPFISPDTDVLRLNVEQSVKQVKSTQTTNGTSAPSLTTRSVKTNIVMTSGQTAVLGGLIQDQVQVTETKVPFLGDIPVLGWLFKGKKTQKDKVNLMVFLTPKVIRNPKDQKELLNNKLDARIDFIRRHGTGRDPHGKLFEEMRNGATSKVGEVEEFPSKQSEMRSQSPSENQLQADPEEGSDDLDLENATLKENNDEGETKFE